MTNWRSEIHRMTGAYSPSTIRCYIYDITSFENWCISEGLDAFPADQATICAFIVSQGQTKATATVRRQLYAIRKIHSLFDLPDPTGLEDVNLAYRKLRRSKLNRQKQAKGMTKKYLEHFMQVQPAALIGLRNKAMLSVAYDLLTRRSELVALRADDISYRNDGTIQLIIRRSKTDQDGHGRVAFCSKRSTELIELWLKKRNCDIGPLFCPVYKGIPVDRHLSPCAVKRLIKQTALKCGLSKDEIASFSGHSMRVGAAQDLLSAGHDTAAIMRAGGWKSIGVLARYLQHAEFNVWA